MRHTALCGRLGEHQGVASQLRQQARLRQQQLTQASDNYSTACAGGACVPVVGLASVSGLASGCGRVPGRGSGSGSGPGMNGGLMPATQRASLSHCHHCRFILLRLLGCGVLGARHGASTGVADTKLRAAPW